MKDLRLIAKVSKKLFSCKHRASDLVITETGVNMVSGYCRSCYQTITFMPEKISQTIDKILKP